MAVTCEAALVDNVAALMHQPPEGGLFGFANWFGVPGCCKPAVAEKVLVSSDRFSHKAKADYQKNFKGCGGLKPFSASHSFLV